MSVYRTFLSMDYKKDIFVSFAYEFEPSVHFCTRHFEQLSRRLALSLTVPNFRKNQAISDRFLAPSEKNARLSQGQRDGQSLFYFLFR